jgi:uncharacterized protein (TIGR02246 family)
MFAHFTPRAGGFWVFAGALAAACLLVAAPAAMAQAKPKTVPAQAPAADKPTGDEAAIRAGAEDYEKAFNGGDAKAVADFWAKDGEFVDETGRQFSGREAIEKEFAAIFADQKDAQIDVTVDSVKFLSPEVAVESGSTRPKSPKGAVGTPVKYTAVLVKADGRWLLENVSESRPAVNTSGDRLASLGWLVGEWKATLGKDKTYRMTCQWLPGKTFLSRTFTVKTPEGEASAGTQIVGWDPTLGGIVSWTFDSSGGFGHEMWEDRGGEWRIEASSVLPDGATSLSTNLLSKISDNTFTWRSVERSLNEQLLPDTAEVRVERVSQ